MSGQGPPLISTIVVIAVPSYHTVQNWCGGAGGRSGPGRCVARPRSRPGPAAGHAQKYGQASWHAVVADRCSHLTERRSHAQLFTRPPMHGVARSVVVAGPSQAAGQRQVVTAVTVDQTRWSPQPSRSRAFNCIVVRRVHPGGRGHSCLVGRPRAGKSKRRGLSWPAQSINQFNERRARCSARYLSSRWRAVARVERH